MPRQADIQGHARAGRNGAFLLAQGETIDEILESWPEVKRVAVEEAIRLAAAAWPELLREPVEKKIRSLAAALVKRQTRPAKGTITSKEKTKLKQLVAEAE